MDYLKIEVSGQHPLTFECQQHLMEEIWKRYSLPNRGSMLDIGPGKGFYSRYFLSKGLDVHCLDIDPSLREEFEKMGCKFMQMDLRSKTMPYPDDQFDLVWCSHVIEHLYNYVDFVTDCCRVLKPGGIALFRTPDLESVKFQFWSDPTHVQPFIKVSLRKLLALTGFEVIDSINCDLLELKGLHRVRAYKWMPSLLFKGNNLLGVGRKPR